MRWPVLLAAALAGPACAAETPPAEAECTPPQFAGCSTACGRGVRECQEPGRWGPCRCTLVDASLGTDADDDAPDGVDAAE